MKQAAFLMMGSK